MTYSDLLAITKGTKITIGTFENSTKTGPCTSLTAKTAVLKDFINDNNLQLIEGIMYPDAIDNTFSTALVKLDIS